MKIFSKVSKVLLAVAFTFGLTGSITALAATTPFLGTLNTFGIVSDTSTNSNTSPQTIINGSVCGTTLTAPRPLTITGGAEETPCAPAKGTDQTFAKADIIAQAALPGCISIGAAVDLTLIDIDGVGGFPAGTFPPGCYKSTGTMSIGAGAVTLSGVGTYIFRPGDELTSAADTSITLAGGASACDVFWAPVGATTLGAYTGALPNLTSFAGNIFRGDAAGLSITLGHFSNYLGRMLAFGSTVTTDANTITVPTCSVPAPVANSGSSGFGVVVPPLISITKIPTPLSLPLGAGSVTYDYTVLNIGTVSMSNITVVDNKCSPISLISGDTNFDSKLDMSETWKYRCTTTLATTTTNTVIATGMANGLTAIDTAEAIVVVGVPIIPPLIHVVKIPSTFTLPVGGGAVTYMYTVTNPGTAALNNVSITDDKCTGLPGRVVGHPGDLNKNDLLESNETWSFTCQTNITQTTTNIGTATGSANGLSVTDFALATVVVALPGLPNTGLTPFGESTMMDIIILSVILILVLFLLSVVLKKRKA